MSVITFNVMSVITLCLCRCILGYSGRKLTALNTSSGGLKAAIATFDDAQVTQKGSGWVGYQPQGLRIRNRGHTDVAVYFIIVLFRSCVHRVSLKVFHGRHSQTVYAVLCTFANSRFS